MIYLLLAAGLFMGWSLGTNDAANAFGTAVATRVVKYRTAVTIISIFVLIGAFVGAVIGAGLTKGVRAVNFGIFKNIAIAWISSPTVAGLLAYGFAFVTQGYFK